jgi:FtsH-binding integral membrane protein
MRRRLFLSETVVFMVVVIMGLSYIVYLTTGSAIAGGVMFILAIVLAWLGLTTPQTRRTRSAHSRRYAKIVLGLVIAMIVVKLVVTLPTLGDVGGTP